MPGDLVVDYGSIINEMIFIVDGIMENQVTEIEQNLE